MELHFEQSDTEFYTPFAGLSFVGHTLNKKRRSKNHYEIIETVMQELREAAVKNIPANFIDKHRRLRRAKRFPTGSQSVGNRFARPNLH